MLLTLLHCTSRYFAMPAALASADVIFQWRILKPRHRLDDIEAFMIIRSITELPRSGRCLSPRRLTAITADDFHFRRIDAMTRFPRPLRTFRATKERLLRRGLLRPAVVLSLMRQAWRGERPRPPEAQPAMLRGAHQPALLFGDLRMARLQFMPSPACHSRRICPHSPR